MFLLPPPPDSWARPSPWVGSEKSMSLTTSFCRTSRKRGPKGTRDTKTISGCRHRRRRDCPTCTCRTTSGQPGGSTGWHTHPGHSLIIVTAGTITAYEGDDPECKPTVHTQGMGFVDAGAGHVHNIRNEGDVVAQTIAVQLMPADQGRRIDVAAPRKLPLLTRAERLAAATSDPWDAYLVPRPGIAAAVDRGWPIYAVQQYRTTEDDG